MTGTASYRVQVREGVDFDAVREQLDHIAGLGVDHLYLAPILQAAPGSTHGYDVIDPTEIDPELGGRAGFERLAADCAARGLKIILDIVPNHMAFGPDTPWLMDVLKRGPDSEHGAIFDIDWDAGPLALPWLTRSLTEAAEDGAVAVEGDDLQVDALRLPLAPGSAGGLSGQLSAADAERLHTAQHWQLLPWQLERDSITHRRFFSVTSLIGVRIEHEAVFERIHSQVFDLVDKGLVQGLRVDHVDGLVDPEGYLTRLRARLPDIPIWIEKILVSGEDLPDWPVTGTTGYEAATVIARMLTDTEGLARIDALWRAESGIEGAFHPFVEDAKREILTDELAAELRQLRSMAEAAAEADGRLFGPEMLREALSELLVAFPRYRSYISDTSRDEDVRLWRESAARAGEHVRSSDVIDWITETVLALETPQARRLALRLQQVTGALIAKAHEDTAGFRFNRYLPSNEVGADPDHPTTDAESVQRFLDDRLSRWPDAITLGSTHDTKRSEDARARLIAMTHDPEAMRSLWESTADLPGTETLDANRRFYAFQAALALWGEPEAHDRVADHMVKALREGKEVSYWTAPDEEREGKMRAWAQALLGRWDADRPEPLLRLVELGAGLSLRELALRCLFPGMPDIYQGGEAALLQLTDPDNRRAPDWAALRDPQGGLSSRKSDLLRTCLSLRRAEPALFDRGTALWMGDGLTRSLEGRGIALDFSRNGEGEVLWRDQGPLPLILRRITV